MNLDRLETIINCYGSDPGRWPSDERQAALDFINSSRTARQALQASTTSAMQLDAWLASDASLTAPQQLQHRIAQRATEQVLGSSMQGGLTMTRSTTKDTTKNTDNLLERFFTWLLPDPTDLINSFWKNSFWKNSFWKSGLVACLPLVVGMVWGNFTTTSMSTAGFFFQEEQQEEQQEGPQEGPQEAPYLEEQYQEELYLLALTEQTPQQWSAVWMEE